MGQAESRENTDDDPEKFPSISRHASINFSDSEVACEEAARLTAAEQEEPDEDALSYCDYHDLPAPPDGGYGWVVVFASFMCNMIVDGIAYTFGIFLTPMVDYFGESKGKTAWVGSLLSGTLLTVGPIVSALTNKFGCRAVCISGSIIATIAFVLSTVCPTVNWLMLVYGVIGGIGFGLIYLPAVVCVGYYFEKKRSLATGIAVCGSGVGTFAFAPLASVLLEEYGWKGANLIFSGIILNCVLFGALMRPLTYPKESNTQPLLQRMAEERRIQMERGSIGGSYFMVQLPDGTMEKRLKQPLNIDPGVHSSLNLDQLAPGTPITPIPTVPTLPTIAEVKVQEQSGSSGSPSPRASAAEIRPQVVKNPRLDEIRQQDGGRIRRDSGSIIDANNTNESSLKLPRNASQPAMSTHVQGLPKNGSVPTFDRIRKTSVGERYKPTLGPIKSSSKATISSTNDMKRLRNNSNSSFLSRNINSEVDVESLTSKLSLSRERSKNSMIPPLVRKDIFYSGSISNLPEFHQSQRSLSSYRQSIVSLPRHTRQDGGGEPGDICPCLVLPESFKSALAQMLDVTLLKNPVFLLIGISNLFGMAGLYVPFVYLVECAIEDNIDKASASFLLSIIGITNTFSRIACGYFADFPSVNALFVNNVCLVILAISVALTPLCHTYGAYVTIAVIFGVAVSGYISLTSIILVDLLGLDKLTNAFGLLILFRGAAAIFGSPLAGALYDATNTYDVPFYVAGALFAISAITSFLAPCMKRYANDNEQIITDIDGLTPIDEDDEEEDGPITIGQGNRNGGSVTAVAGNGGGGGGGATGKNVVPTIIETASSPNEREIKQIESVL